MTAQEFQEEVFASINKDMGSSYSRIDDPFSTSSSGYNSARWASRGYSAAWNLVETTPPQPGEAAPAYGKRLLEKLHELKNRYRYDAGDEDGFAMGAVGEVISRAERLLRELGQENPPA
jgi:hypothetical protein